MEVVYRSFVEMAGSLMKGESSKCGLLFRDEAVWNDAMQAWGHMHSDVEQTQVQLCAWIHWCLLWNRFVKNYFFFKTVVENYMLADISKNSE